MIEPLEPRIAPATLTGRVLTYTDLDGDRVKVTFTKGTLAATNFTFDTTFDTSGPQELQKIDVGGVSDVTGSNLTVAVAKAPGGDGIVNIGAITATGKVLGVIKVKGHLGSYNSSSTTSLTALSIGILGTKNQAPSPSFVTGALGSVTIAGSVGNSFGAASLITLKVGGSIIGDGSIFIDGPLTTAKIGGSLATDPTSNALDFYVRGTLGSLSIKGSVIGGITDSQFPPPQVFIEGPAKSIKIGGDVRGSTGTFTQAAIRVNGAVGSIFIGGSVIGTAGLGTAIRLADSVNTFGQGVDSLVINGSISNAVIGVSLSLTNSQAIAKAITINGSFVASGIAVSGGAGVDGQFGTGDDVITPSSVIGNLVIKGPIYGTAGGTDSFAINAGKILRATITGRMQKLDGGKQSLSIASSGDFLLRDLA